MSIAYVIPIMEQCLAYKTFRMLFVVVIASFLMRILDIEIAICCNNFKPLQNLETMYCRMPQSYRVEDMTKCSSMLRLFDLLGNGCVLDSELETRNGWSRQTENKLEVNSTIDNNEDEVEKVNTAPNKKSEDEMEDEELEESEEENKLRANLTPSFVISMLFCSAIFSLLEWLRERTRKPDEYNIDGVADPSRRISLADFTLNRHLRRDSQNQMDPFSQNSTKSSPTWSRPPLLRRSSFPAQFPQVRSRSAAQRQLSTPGTRLSRRLSLELYEETGFIEHRRIRLIRRR